MTRYEGRREDLAQIAVRVLRDRGLEPEFPQEAISQSLKMREPSVDQIGDARDLSHLPWCSIDNDDSRDLDQLTHATELPDGAVRVTVAIADVDSLVRKNSPIDVHARRNTTSIYTPARIFPMLPERLSTDLTSLNPDVSRLALVVSYTVSRDGEVADGEIFRAWVYNRAKLAYRSVGAWLEGEGEMPAAMADADGVEAQILLQDRVATLLRRNRYAHGALDLETIEAKAVWSEDSLVDLEVEASTRAHQLIEDFMIAANGVTSRYLENHGLPSFRRVVRSPERWDRIEALAASLGDRLPTDPDSRALNEFLQRRRRADPETFADLSLTVVKLLGKGEYVVHLPGEDPLGHFGLAVRNYSHSTAPNRRYPDMITHRLVKSVLSGDPPSYGRDELDTLATHCTIQEDNVKKAERQVRKSAAAMLLEQRIGQKFEGIVTGAAQKGTWVRIFHPPVEGRLVDYHDGLDVGDRVTVKLVEVDVPQGYIDFTLSGTR